MGEVMRMPTKECERASNIKFKCDAGLFVEPEQQRFVDEHLATCPDCKLEQAVFDIAAKEDDNTGALPVFDDLTRRRYTDDIIARADELQFGTGAAEDNNTNSRARHARVYALVGGLIAASFAAVFIWTASPPPQIDSTPIQNTSVVAKNTEHGLNGRFVLLAGEVQIGRRNAAIGDLLMSGDHIETQDGRAAVSLPEEINLSVGPQTRLRVERSVNAEISVFVEHGQIQVALSPRGKRPSFQVITDKGRVNVTGTIFSVNAQARSVEVRVLRGKVEVTESNGRMRHLGTHGAMSLGSSRMWTISEKEEQDLWREVRVLELLDSEDNTVVDIHSRPAGAMVAIDSVLLGQTPISAAVRTGYRNIALSIGGKTVAQELIDVTSGTRLSRVFDLSSVSSEATASKDSQSESRHSAKDRGAGMGAESDEPKVSASELLDQAQNLRAERDWLGATATYRRLIGSYPGTDEARASLVSLGEIELDKLGDPAAALRHFRRYLDTGKRGPLVQEAMFGKAGAFHALGRPDAERQTLELFLERFPSAIQANQVQRRLVEL
jgi:ferric-dicitrate binding protein FerR (iron transport regulator)